MKPILFNTDMVRAILEGRKTVTRRAAKPQPDIVSPHETNPFICFYSFLKSGDVLVKWTPHKPGDILYVRETWAENPYPDGGYMYRAFPGDGCSPEKEDAAMRSMGLKWRPSIHMPREAARIILRVTDVRVERLQDIAEDDIAREGIQSKKPEWLKTEFADLWNSTVKPADHALYSWAANPWVWVIQFERISREEAMRNA